MYLLPYKSLNCILSQSVRMTRSSIVPWGTVQKDCLMFHHAGNAHILQLVTEAHFYYYFIVWWAGITGLLKPLNGCKPTPHKPYWFCLFNLRLHSYKNNDLCWPFNQHLWLLWPCDFHMTASMYIGYRKVFMDVYMITI